MLEAELDEMLARARYARRMKPPSDNSGEAPAVTGHRHGHRSRSLLGTFAVAELLPAAGGARRSGTAKRRRR